MRERLVHRSEAIGRVRHDVRDALRSRRRILGRIVDEHETGDAPGVLRRRISRAAAAHRMADQGGARPAQMIENADDVLRHRGDRVVLLRAPVRVAEAAHVHRHDLALGA